LIKTFPKQKGYHVNWLGGTGGGFLLTLTYLVEKQINRVIQTYDFKSKKLMSFPSVTSTALAHDNINMIDANWDRKLTPKYYEEYVRKIAVYDIIEPHDRNKPIFFFDHFPVEPYTFFTMYPLCKLIVISVDEMDRQVAYGNLFLKTNEMFNHIKIIKPEKFKDYETQFDIPIDVLQKYIEAASSSVIINDIFHKDIKVEEKYIDKMYKIDFRKLISDKEYVLDTVSSITRKPVTVTAEEFTMSYLVNHRNLIKTRLPWLVDYVYQK